MFKISYFPRKKDQRTATRTPFASFSTVILTRPWLIEMVLTSWSDWRFTVFSIYLMQFVRKVKLFHGVYLRWKFSAALLCSSVITWITSFTLCIYLLWRRALFWFSVISWITSCSSWVRVAQYTRGVRASRAKMNFIFDSEIDEHCTYKHGMVICWDV